MVMVNDTATVMDMENSLMIRKNKFKYNTKVRWNM